MTTQTNTSSTGLERIPSPTYARKLILEAEAEEALARESLDNDDPPDHS